MGSHPRSFGGRTSRRAAALAVALLIAFPVLLFAHLALQGSDPGDGSRLDEVPKEVVLTFTQAVEVPVSTVVLEGPAGEVAVGPLESNEEGTVLRAPIVGEMKAGEYRVRWQAVGLDGHPVRGELTFVVEEGAAGLPVPVVETVPGPPAEAMAPPAGPLAPDLPTFDARSPLYAAVRGTTYLGILGTTGAAGFLLLLLGLQRAGVEPAVAHDGFRGAATLGFLAGLVTLVALPLRLQAQSHALFGGGITGERLSLLLGSTWGSAWTVQAVGTAAALVGFLLARRAPAPGLAVAALGAFALSLSPAMSGHAAAVTGPTAAAILSDGLHVLAAGTWLGTLLALVVVGIPLVRRQLPADRPPFVARLLAAFSPVALGAAAVVAATGLFASLLHLQAIPDLWSTGYGRLLSAKLFVVLLVVGAGAYNWRRLTPRGNEPGAELRLRQTATFELVAAALVVALTSVLVAVPPPAEGAGPAESAMTTSDR